MISAKKALILRGCTDSSCREMISSYGWNGTIVSNLPQVMAYIEQNGSPDAIFFMGGTDVDPAVYGAVREPTTQHPDKRRDEFEVAVYEMFKDSSVYLFGICRGAQLLNVLNGGKMIQECGYRGGEAPIYINGFVLDSEEWEVKALHTVCHHQGIIVDKGKVHPYIKARSEDDLDYLFYYPETRSLGIQGHPEWGAEHTESLFMKAIEKVMS